MVNRWFLPLILLLAAIAGAEDPPPVPAPCRVRPIFLNAGRDNEPLPLEQFIPVTLIRYDRQPKDEGVVIRRWTGDTSGNFKYVPEEERKLGLQDFTEDGIDLEPGIYQFKHNSVSGMPPAGFYGESRFFEIKPGQETLDVPVHLYPAI